jgi:hypothetical protein
LAAAIAMAAVLSFSGIAIPRARCQGLPGLGAGDLAFPYGADIVALGRDGPRRIGAWPGDARPRDAAAFPGGFVAWERKSKTLYRASQSGLVALGRLDAARVYLSSSRAIASNGVFEAGKGFGFTVWSWPGGASGSLRKLAGFSLDCFVSDCLFAGNRAFLAGADAADRANSLYELNLDSGAIRRVAMVPKLRDFGRLASDGTRLLFYTSVAEPATAGAVAAGGPAAGGGAATGTARRTAQATLFEIGPGGRALAPVPVSLDPGIDGASPYGSAFALGGRFFLPFAAGQGAGTRVWLCAFDLPGKPAGGSGSGGSAQPAGVVKALSSQALPTGIYAPIGEAGGGFWAFGYLYVKDPAAFSLLRLGGASVSATALPLVPWEKQGRCTK